MIEKFSNNSFLNFYPLYQKLSFWTGLSKANDIFNSINRLSNFNTSQNTDYVSLQSDWTAIGSDLYSTFTSYRNK